MISPCPTNNSFCVLKGNSHFIHQLSPWNEAKYINGGLLSVAFFLFISLSLFFFLLQAVQSMKIAKRLRVPVVLCCMKAGSYNFGIKISFFLLLLTSQTVKDPSTYPDGIASSRKRHSLDVKEDQRLHCN